MWLGALLWPFAVPVLAVLAIAFVIAGIQAQQQALCSSGGVVAGTGSGGAPTAAAISQIPNKPYPLIQIYMAASQRYPGVPWNVLAGINYVETDFGRNLSTSSAGAIGWMQFLPSSWTIYGVDGNGDGTKDPYNPWDAIFAAANLLKQSGAATNLRGAIFAYNHSTAYVDDVMSHAQMYAQGGATTGTAVPVANTTPAPTVPAGGQRVVASIDNDPNGAYGDLASQPASFAELSNNPSGPLDFSALGHLAPHTLLRVSNPYTGVTLVLEKLDIGGGGPFHPKIDIWQTAASVLKVGTPPDSYGPGGYVNIAPAQPGDVPSLTPISGAAASVSLTGLPGGCTSAVSAQGIVQEALKLAWPEPPGSVNPPRNPLQPTPAYAAAVKQYNPGAPVGGADCGAFVGIVMHASGADTNYPPSGTSLQLQYVEGSSLYTTYKNITSVNQLQPGDILIVNAGGGVSEGHTMIYVGPQPGGYNAASASNPDRMPNLTTVPPNLDDPLGRGHYVVARLKNASLNVGFIGANGYISPFTNPVTPTRMDQGIDYSMAPGSPIRVIGAAHIMGVLPDWYAGQPYIWYKLLSGSLAGKYVYVAEQITGTPGIPSDAGQATASLQAEVGKDVPAGTPIAYYATSGSAIETGFATSSGGTLARATGGYVENDSTAAAVSFNKLMVSLHVPDGSSLTYPTVLGSSSALQAQGYP